MKSEAIILYVIGTQCHRSVIDLGTRKKYVRLLMGPTVFAGAFLGNKGRRLGKCHYRISQNKRLSDLILVNDEKLRALIRKFGSLSLLFSGSNPDLDGTHNGKGC